MTAQPVRIVTVRHQCPYCSRSWAKKKAAAAHIARCWKNPEVRACRTCHFYRPIGSHCQYYGRAVICRTYDEETCLHAQGPGELHTIITGCELWEPRWEAANTL